MGAHHDHSHAFMEHARHVLYTVFALNFAMFLLEVWQGTQAGSTALIADSMDFLSDSASYLITLHVLSKPLHVRARAALLKAGLMLVLALFAFAQGIHNILTQHVPEATTMGWVALLAFFVNFTSAGLLYGTRGKDSNMESVWLCSRNDAIANLAILIAAILVYYTGSLWPDLAVALMMTTLGIRSAMQIIRHAKKELRHDH